MRGARFRSWTTAWQDDVALVGFDDVPFAAHVWPRLTTLRQDARGQGMIAADALLRMILDPESRLIQARHLVGLVVRESSGATPFPVGARDGAGKGEK